MAQHFISNDWHNILYQTMILPCVSNKKHCNVFPQYIHRQVDLLMIDKDDSLDAPKNYLDAKANRLSFRTFPIRLHESTDTISVRIKDDGELKQIYQLHQYTDKLPLSSIDVPCHEGARTKLVVSPLDGVQLPGYVFWFHAFRFHSPNRQDECIVC